jgi:hypothetical protein
MTYTFKLARRLAVSRKFVMLPAILLFAACSGDVTAPESPAGPLGPRPPVAVPVTVSVTPSKVTVETNQLIRFLGYGRNGAGDSVYAPIAWRATGGTILPDGRFSSASTGTFMVTGEARDRGEERVDTSIVTVVRRQPMLQAIEITPTEATLAPGTSHDFAVTGRLRDGRPVPVGVTWAATGGTIDAGGTFVAGDTAGTYQVTATNTSMTLADTAIVTITEPAPSPPPPPPPPPAPVLEKVTLLPASATLAPSATRQFVAYGRTTAGDSIDVNVVFTATGGTVTAGGLYTAGATAGSYRVIATSSGLADTSSITVTRPLGSGPGVGLPFGTFHVPVDSLNDPALNYNSAVFTAVPSKILSTLNAARARNARIVLAILRSATKDAYGLSVAAARAELAKWPDISSYIADGTVIAVYVSDDILSPEWGPNPPYLSRIDSIAREVKLRWPNAITMVRAKPSELAGRSKWLWLEAAWAQYRGPYRDPPPKLFADREVVSAKAQGLGLVIGFNTLNGGCGPTSACLSGVPGTHLLGTYNNAAEVRRYQMSAAEVLHYGKAFVAEPYNCAAISWQYSPVYRNGTLTPEHLALVRAFDRRPDVRAAMAELAQLANQRSNTNCRQR